MVNIVHELEREIKENMLKEDIPGLAISLIKNDKILWMKCFGFTDRKNSKIVDKNTIFSIQSIGKVFTTVAFLRAVQNGLVKLDAKYLKAISITVNKRIAV